MLTSDRSYKQNWRLVFPFIFFSLLFPNPLNAQDIGKLAMRARINLYETWNFDSVAYYLDLVIGKEFAPAFAYSDYGWYLMLVNQYDKGMEYIERAAKMKAPDQTQLMAWNAWALQWNSELAKAEQWIDQTLAIDPDFGEGLFVASLIASDKGHHQKAVQLAEKSASIDPNWRAGVPLALAKSGQYDEALLRIQKIAKNENRFDSMILMEAYAYMKNGDKAMEYLEKSYHLRHPFLPWIQFIPAMKYLHNHPKFKEVVQKLKLPKSYPKN